MLHYVQHDKMIGDQKFSDSLPRFLFYLSFVLSFCFTAKKHRSMKSICKHKVDCFQMFHCAPLDKIPSSAMII